MAYSFKVYISGEKEYFEYGNEQKTIKKGFVFSQSLMDLLYLDIMSYSNLFEKMGADLRQLYSEKDTRLADKVRKGLDTIAKKHIYFELVRLDWLNRLEQAEDRKFEDVVDLLPIKKLTHIPSEIVTIQEQVKRLWENVLDVLSPKEPIQKKMAEYYEGKARTALRFFRFSRWLCALNELTGKPLPKCCTRKIFTKSSTILSGNVLSGNCRSVSVRTAGSTFP